MLIDTINQDIIDMMKTKNPDLVVLRTFKSEINWKRTKSNER